MKHRMKYLLACAALLAAAAPGNAQKLRSFSSDPVKFFDEMKAFIAETNEGTSEDVMTEFRVIWDLTGIAEKDLEKVYERANKALDKRTKGAVVKISHRYGPSTGRINDIHREIIYLTANQMLKKRMKAIPDFTSYLYTLINFTITGQPENSFDSFMASILKMLENRTARRFTAYLEICDNLFSENALYASAAVKWVAGNGSYVFGYDSLPKIEFSSLDLRCLARKDSSVIYGTKGVLYPTELTWYGEGGKVNWERAGIGEETVVANLGKYEISVKSSHFTADSVTFYNRKYFDFPLIGKLEEKILADVTEEKASYPRFQSYQARYMIKDIIKDVDYVGGFAMKGSTVIGSGNEEDDAQLLFYREGNRFLKAGTKTFIIKDDRIVSDYAAVTIYLEDDSIYHPGLTMKLDREGRELSLIRENRGVSQSPYFNTYHDLDMYFDALYWKLDDPTVDFRALRGSTKDDARFESSDYYKQHIFDRLRGLDDVHPLTKIKRYVDNYGEEIDTKSLAEFINLPVNQVRSLLITLAIDGFLIYDFDDDKAHVKNKLYRYLSAKAEKVDYDVLQFKSVISAQANASINLLNNELKMRGVSRIALSDSQNVYIYPHEQEIIMGKNRDFTFSGKVDAGRFEFYGKKFAFEYDNFKIRMANIDSMRMYVLSKEVNKHGQRDLVPVKTVVEALEGELLIDHTENKSGIKPFAQYPIFKSAKDSYVFYQKSSIQNGVYTRERFYFHLEPFAIDSLNRFSPEGLELNGNFVSAGIFPDFEEKLTVQPDYSLGFVRSTPAGGFPAYGGKGLYHDKINLSHRGLRGDGTLEYVTSTTKSNDFIFLPDSMNTVAQSFDVREQGPPVEFPAVHSDSVYVHWMPYRDRMEISDLGAPMAFYNNQSKFHGLAELTPQGLTGGGLMSFGEAELEAKLMKFRQTEFVSDTADFRLAALELQQLAFSTVNVNAHVDFVARKAKFKSNGGGSFVEFPVNQYVCYMDQFTWYMDEGSIEMSAGKQEVIATEAGQDLRLEGSRFISQHPKQDSLSWVAPRASYSLRNYVIAAEEVKLIAVADAIVYPGDGKVVIHKRAEMQPLEKAKILANRVTRYHNIYDATVNVTGKNAYTATGLYDFVDELGGKQTIYLDRIGVDTTIQTYGEGQIADTADFTLSSFFEYRGKVRLEASLKHLRYTGSCRIKHECSRIGRSWFRFDAEIDPGDIYIPVDSNSVSENNIPLFAGIYHGGDSAYIYSAFMTPMGSRRDEIILAVQGYLFYHKGAQEYRIATKEKLVEQNLPGSYISLSVKDCILYGEGKLDLGIDAGQVAITAAGTITHYLIPDSVMLETMLALDFFFSDDAEKIMTEELKSFADLKPVDLGVKTYEKGIREFVDKKAADKYIAEVNLGTVRRVPDELVRSLIFAGVKLKYSRTEGSFVSVGPIGLAGVKKEQLNRYYDGCMEFERKRSGDRFNIYLAADENTWYLFQYQRGLMQVISSNDLYNKGIMEMKPEDRRSKAESREQGPYQFMVSTRRKKEDFLEKCAARQ